MDDLWLIYHIFIIQIHTRLYINDLPDGVLKMSSCMLMPIGFMCNHFRWWNISCKDLFFKTIEEYGVTALECCKKHQFCYNYRYLLILINKFKEIFQVSFLMRFSEYTSRLFQFFRNEHHPRLFDEIRSTLSSVRHVKFIFEFCLRNPEIYQCTRIFNLSLFVWLGVGEYGGGVVRNEIIPLGQWRRPGQPRPRVQGHVISQGSMLALSPPLAST